MKKKNSFLSYGLTVLMGVLGLTTTVNAQNNAQAPIAKKAVTVSDDLAASLKEVFLKPSKSTTGPKKLLHIEKTVYFADSAKHIVGNESTPRDLGTNTILTFRVSDREQLVMIADDVNGDRIIDENEVTFLADYVADEKKVMLTSVLKDGVDREGSVKYRTMHMYAKTKDQSFQFNYEDYSHQTEWGMAFKQWPEQTQGLLDVFKLENRGWNFNGWKID